MPSGTHLYGITSRLQSLRGQARDLRGLTEDPELRWDLTQAEALAEVVISRQAGLSPLVLQAHVDYLANLLGTIRDQIGS
jgi:hypothetical protein